MVDQLKCMADALQEGSSPEERFAALQKTFALFMEESERLENSYRKLVEKKDRALQAKIAELDMTTRYLDSILRNMSQGMLFIDITGRITTYNRAAEQILKKSSEEVLGKPFTAAFSEKLLGFGLAEALAKREAPETSYAHLEDGAYLEVSTTLALDEEESAKGLIVLLRDITQLRRLQTIASRNDRMKELGEMAASVAHEIRNPLGGIKGFASLLYRDLEDRPELQAMAKQMVDGSITLDALVTDVLNYSRPVQLHVELCNFRTFFCDLVAFVKADEGLGKEITITVEGEDLIVPIDVHSMRRALLNIMVNAAQAMPEGGKICVSWGKEKGEVVLQIGDSGCGIPVEQLENIFSPFFTTKPQGNGFGLSEVHKIVQAHGGSIEVESTIGKGTTFTILLPTKT